jgi:hypothetical protein
VDQRDAPGNVIGTVVQPGQRQVQDRQADGGHLVIGLTPLVVLDAPGVTGGGR